MRIRRFQCFLFVCLMGCGALYACDTLQINPSKWQVLQVSSEELEGEGSANGAAIYAFDGDASTYWHSQWKNGVAIYPHYLAIDLNDTLSIDGFAVTTRQGTTNGRIANYELYITNDTSDWGYPELGNRLIYPSPTDQSQQRLFCGFGAVSGRYVKLVALSSLQGDDYAMIAELELYRDSTCAPTGQRNQSIVFPNYSKQYTHLHYLPLQASVSSGLPLTYQVLDGPGEVRADTLWFTGGSGTIKLEAQQGGDATYYPATAMTTIQVVNLQNIVPVAKSHFTDAYPLEMPNLYPYLLCTEVTIGESDSLSIASVSYQIGDTIIVGKKVNSSYQAWWCPTDFGDHEVSVLAIASNGQQVQQRVVLHVARPEGNRTVQTFDKGVIDFGSMQTQWYKGHYQLPQFVGAYKQIIAYFDVSCPNVDGGCDDWDRLAWVEVRTPNGKWVELFRYITPYGVACSHSVDLTDYASLLQGEVDIRMFIETWGSGGWQLDLSLEYVEGKPDYRYQSVQTVWHGTYNFGDPANLQPMDTVTLSRYPQSEVEMLRLVTTGHGWGANNTSNAAEFYNATHTLKINGESCFEHNPWQKCNPNPDGCTGQRGSWKFDRAGWCSGTIGQIHSYNLTPYLNDEPVKLSYIFQESYVDKCHPHNPDCVSGVTCNDCNDTYNPMYRIGGYYIQQSNQPIGAVPTDYVVPDNDEPLRFTVYPNPVHDALFFDGVCEFNKATLLIVDNSGKTYRTYYFDAPNALLAKPIDVSSLPEGIYFLKLYTNTRNYARKIVITH